MQSKILALVAGQCDHNAAKPEDSMPSLASRFCYALVVATAPLLLQSLSAFGQSSETKVKVTGSISGRVTIEGKPAAGIPVAAVAGQTVNRRDAASRAVTDGAGYYRLAGLEPGQYQIWTLTPGLIAETVGPSGYYFPYFGSNKTIILGANEDVANVDLKLVRGSVITGRVTDAENKPVVEELVSLELLDEKGNSRLNLRGSYNEQMSRTDDRGIYRIYGLPAGRYRVSVGYDQSEGIIRESNRQRTFHPDTTDESKAAIVELKEGGEANNIDVRVGRSTNTYSVSGRVIDLESGLPIARAGVTFALVRKDQGSSSHSFGVQTDDRGEFRLDGFPPGGYSVVATSQYFSGNCYGDPVYFDVRDNDVTGLEIKAIPGLSLSGFVVAESLTIKELLALLPGLRVFASATTQSSSSGQAAGGNSVVAPDGSFQINGLRPGRVSIDVSARTATRPTIARIEQGGVVVSQGFEMQQSISGVNVVINYGTGAIRGVVRFAGGDLPADSRIFVNFKREGARDGDGAQVDARGHFVIKNLAPGTYEVTLQVALGGPTHRQLPQPPKQLANVTNGSEAEVNFLVGP